VILRLCCPQCALAVSCVARQPRSIPAPSLNPRHVCGPSIARVQVMYTQGPGSNASYGWYCLHFTQSNQPALTYLAEVAAWVRAHPTELLVMWLSWHGDSCDTAGTFPDVPTAAMHSLWAAFQTLFDGLLLDASVSALNQTTVGQLLARGHRVATYWSPAFNFTGGSPLAQDGCLIDNNGDGVDLYGIPNAVARLGAMVASAAAARAASAAINHFMLYSAAASVPGQQIEYALLLEAVPGLADTVLPKCIAAMGVPGNTRCLGHLMDAGTLSNFYVQVCGLHDMWRCVGRGERGEGEVMVVTWHPTRVCVCGWHSAPHHVPCS
jgi:hypothetical protein